MPMTFLTGREDQILADGQYLLQMIFRMMDAYAMGVSLISASGPSHRGIPQRALSNRRKTTVVGHPRPMAATVGF